MITKKKLLRLFPTIVIYFAVVLSFLNNFYDFNFSVIGNTIGYSIFFNLVIICLLKRLRYCFHTILAMCNLTMLSLYSLLNSLGIIDYDTYYLTYDLLTLIIIFIILMIYSIKK